MPRDPFDSLPPPNRKKFVLALKKHLTPPLESLKRFSDSISRGSYPDWPSNAELSLFARQIETFRLISNRSSDAKPIEVIRDIDHRWPGMHIVRTLDRVVSSVEAYMGRSLLAEAHAEAIKRRRHLKESELHMLVYKERTAEPADLELMAALLPDAFQKMHTLTSKGSLGTLVGAASQPLDKLRRALARSAQEYLLSKQQAYLARLQAAGTLRVFIHNLQDRRYAKRLHGFAPAHIDEWLKAQSREKVRLRAQRFRASKKSAV
jgi:hypothetical protein